METGMQESDRVFDKELFEARRKHAQEMKSLRQRQAAACGLPATMAEYLRGNTAEELLADARRLALAVRTEAAAQVAKTTNGARLYTKKDEEREQILRQVVRQVSEGEIPDEKKLWREAAYRDLLGEITD